MAYRRRRSTPKRAYRKKGSGYAKAKKTTRSRGSYTRGRMRFSKKRILNITSIKKHDNMRPYVQAADGTVTPGPITVGTGFTSLFIPSARVISDESVGEAHRERQSTYSVGYKERVQIEIIGGGSWVWRRIVFTFKGQAFLGGNTPWLDAGSGTLGSMKRLINSPTNTQYPIWRDIIYDGTEGVDWDYEMTAKVDTSRISLISDKTRTFSPGNESGMMRNMTFWYKTGKNLLYNEDEDGSENNQGNYLSVQNKIGMGDLYVYDFVSNIVPAAGGNQALRFRPEGTYYWHEK